MRCIAAASCYLAFQWLAAGAGTTSKLALPHVAAVAHEVERLDAGRQWWTRVGSRLYHKPVKSSPLGEHIEDYYVAVGSRDAVPGELWSHRVGGEGRFHIFYLPKDSSTSLIQSSAKIGSRRASLSKLQRLKHGYTLSDVFPEYLVSAGYRNPLSLAGEGTEKKLIKAITLKGYEADLRHIVSLGTRSYSNGSAEQAAVSYVQKEFENMGLTTCLQDFGQQTNVVAYLPGKASTGAVVVGAHYDSRPFSGPAPGAEDNGSGLAGLLQIARAAMTAKLAPERPLYFVAFAAEEAGLLGSEAFAQTAVDQMDFMSTCKGQAGKSFLQQTRRMMHRGSKAKKGSAVHSAIIMDEIGWVTSDPQFPKYTVNLESYDSSNMIRDHMTDVSKKYNGDSLHITYSNNPFGSDHMSFLTRGVPAVLTINGDDEAYPDYHKKTDTIENVDMEYAVRIVKMNAGALVRLSHMA